MIQSKRKQCYIQNSICYEYIWGFEATFSFWCVSGSMFVVVYFNREREGLGWEQMNNNSCSCYTSAQIIME